MYVSTLYVCMHVSVCMCVCIICMYVYIMYVCMYVYVCVYACEYLYMYACMCTLCTLTTGMLPITYHSMQFP